MDNLLTRVKFGNTGLLTSRLCFGTLALGPYHSNLTPEEGAALLIESYKQGVNFWDTAELYLTYPHIKIALKQLQYPEDIVIASRSFARTFDEMKQAIEQGLSDLEIKSFDIFGLHELTNIKDYEESRGAFEALREAKRWGVIKNIAVSMHSVEVLSLIAQQKWVDVVFPLYNKHSMGIRDGNVDDMTAAIKTAFDNGKAVYAMKVLAGGHLSKSAEECIRFVLCNPYIHSIAIGMDNIDELNLNHAIFTEQNEKVSIYKPKVHKQRKSIQVDPWCEGCGECLKICPNNAITLEFSQAKIDENKCVLCGYCASACKYFCLKVVNVK